MVIDHLSGRVVWAGKERKAKTLLRFFRKLGPQRAAELEAVSMDMWEPYITVVGKKAPQARVIFDRFHIVKHLNEAVDKTRRELVRELKGTARRNLKNTKFPLLKAKHNRSAKDKRVLREQVRANRRLYRAMLLRDDFMDLYTYKTETWAKKFLRGWLRRWDINNEERQVSPSRGSTEMAGEAQKEQAKIARPHRTLLAFRGLSCQLGESRQRLG